METEAIPAHLHGERPDFVLGQERVHLHEVGEAQADAEDVVAQVHRLFEPAPQSKTRGLVVVAVLRA